MNWKQLQEKVTNMFQNVGCSATESKTVEGARGKHTIDVFVEFTTFSFKCTWIIECKHWKSNVTKEKVLALSSIVQDVGADKGVIVCTSDFQSGAIRCAQNTNIILTNLEDLSEYISDQMEKEGWAALSSRVQKLSAQYYSNVHDSARISKLGTVSIIGINIIEARYGSGRMVLIKDLNQPDGDENFICFNNPCDFISHANYLLDELNER